MGALIDEQMEARSKLLGDTNTRLKASDLDALVVGEEFHLFFGKLTICVLLLKNGFTVVGEAAAVDITNFNEQTGRDVARAEARDKIWLLEGYRLQQELYEQKQEPEADEALRHLDRLSKMMDGKVFDGRLMLKTDDPQDLIAELSRLMAIDSAVHNPTTRVTDENEKFEDLLKKTPEQAARLTAGLDGEALITEDLSLAQTRAGSGGLEDVSDDIVQEPLSQDPDESLNQIRKEMGLPELERVRGEYDQSEGESAGRPHGTMPGDDPITGDRD